MEDAVRMQAAQPVRDLRADGHRRLERRLWHAVEQLAQGVLDEFHHDCDAVAETAGVVYRHDVRVRQPRRRARIDEEPLFQRREHAAAIELLEEA